MAVLALVAAIGMTARDVGTKLISQDLSTLLLSLYASMLFCISGGVLLLFTGRASIPDSGMILLFIAMTALGSLGYILVTTAVRLGSMSTSARSATAGCCSRWRSESSSSAKR